MALVYRTSTVRLERTSPFFDVFCLFQFFFLNVFFFFSSSRCLDSVPTSAGAQQVQWRRKSYAAAGLLNKTKSQKNKKKRASYPII